MGSASRIHQYTAPQNGFASRIHQPKGVSRFHQPKGGPHLEFINIQPPKRSPPLEFINQRGSASRFHQPKRRSASRDNFNTLYVCIRTLDVCSNKQEMERLNKYVKYCRKQRHCVKVRRWTTFGIRYFLWSRSCWVLGFFWAGWAIEFMNFYISYMYIHCILYFSSNFSQQRVMINNFITMTIVKLCCHNVTQSAHFMIFSVSSISYRPTELSLLKEFSKNVNFWKFYIFH